MVTNAIDPGGYYRSSSQAGSQSDPYASMPGRGTPGGSGSPPSIFNVDPAGGQGPGGTSPWGQGGGGSPHAGIYSGGDNYGGGFNFGGGGGGTSSGPAVNWFQEGGAVDTGDDGSAPQIAAPDTVPAADTSSNGGMIDSVRAALGYGPAQQGGSDQDITGGVGDKSDNAPTPPDETILDEPIRKFNEQMQRERGIRQAPGQPPQIQKPGWLQKFEGFSDWANKRGLITPDDKRPPPKNIKEWALRQIPFAGYAEGGAVDTNLNPRPQRRRGPGPHDPAGRRAVHAHVQRALDFGRQKYGLTGGGAQPAIPAGGYLTGGVVRGFDDGGPMDDDSQALPPDDQAGAIPTDQPAPPPQQQPAGPQGIMRYLTGADAMSPQQVQQIERSIDPNGDMTRPDRAAAAVASMAADDPAAGFSALQHYRNSYEHAKQFAAHAADRGDMPAAANAANIAFANVPNTKHYTFAANGRDASDGITMTVTDQDGRSTSTNLDQQQLAGLMKNRATMFDAMADMGAAGQGAGAGDVTGATQQQAGPGWGDTLSQVVNPRGFIPNAKRLINYTTGANLAIPPETPDEPPAVAAPDTAPAAGAAAPATGPAEPATTQFGRAAGPREGPIAAPPEQPAAAAEPPPGPHAAEAKEREVSERIIKTSHERFPWISQEPQRLDWIEKQRQQEEENKSAQTKIENVLKAAGIRQQGQLDVAKERTNALLQSKELIGQNMLNAIKEKDKGTQKRFILDQLGKDRRVQMSNAGRAIDTVLKDPSKTLDDAIDVAKKSGTSLAAVLGHAQTMHLPGMGDDAVPFISAPQTIGAGPTQQVGAAPTQGSTQLPNIGGRQFYKGSDGKAHWADTNELVQLPQRQ